MLSDNQLISVIVTTYNWPSALKLCLAALFVQDDRNFEIIIADDGSSTENVQTMQRYWAESPIPVRYVYHPDQGFRAGTIRNKAVAQSRGEYLIFIDGDCLVQRDFVTKHRQLAQTGCFVPGNRVLLTKLYTDQVIAEQLPIYQALFGHFLLLRLQNKINRISAFLRLPLGFLRHVQARKWQKAMTCNLAMWRHDFLNVNGFDELFEGWGYEDSDLVIRLIHAGVTRKEGRFAVPVLHLWHPHNDRSQHDANYQRLLERLQQHEFIRAEKGVAQYLA
ncbi:MAG: glycosyltransferase family 2 protein [Methylococcales bacterium]